MSMYGGLGKAMVDAWLSGKTIKAMLVDGTYTQDQAHLNRSDITGEVTGTNYTAGGVVVTGVATSLSGAETVITANTVTFANVTIASVAGIVFYHASGSASTDRLICADFFPAESPSAVDFVYDIPAEGLIAFRAL